MRPAEDLKTITAGRNGEYIPFRFYEVDDAPELMEKVKREADATGDWDTAFSGSFFSNRQMLDELVVILFISVLLMYFILAAQFESFVQPLIVLLEIPIDVAFALLLLWICGHTLNLMSAIGLIVTCGIIINDSILKLDAINELRSWYAVARGHPRGGAQKAPAHHHDIAHHHFRYGSAAVLVRHGLGAAEAAFHSDDWGYVCRNTGQSVHHPVDILVYL